ncbi:hypothetical protein FHL15_005849 [Xylaria flabelliformis]|uniref:Uncharacterized protein n=1 Tax=Xylaria flabelliformis TaxID=2512241 RepID=A0A553HZ91_9PEZI|nr:hypothetical protein FHL15_005849 [Xylaria flabelliformis]
MTRIVDASSNELAKKLAEKSDHSVSLSQKEITDVDQKLDKMNNKLIDTEIDDDEPKGPVEDPSSFYDQPASSVDEMNSAHTAVSSTGEASTASKDLVATLDAMIERWANARRRHRGARPQTGEGLRLI